MITALTNGFLGLGLCLGLSNYLLQWPVGKAFSAVLASNLASFAAVMFTLHGVKWLPPLLRWIKGIPRTLGCLVVTYTSLMLLLMPALQEWRPFLILFGPLALTTGFSIVVFGPIQDRIVRRAQRKAKAESDLKLKIEQARRQEFVPLRLSTPRSLELGESLLIDAAGTPSTPSPNTQSP